MNNLRSDSLELAKKLPEGHLLRVHVLALCNQIDQIEEYWHSAFRKQTELENMLLRESRAFQAYCEASDAGHATEEAWEDYTFALRARTDKIKELDETEKNRHSSPADSVKVSIPKPNITRMEERVDPPAAQMLDCAHLQKLMLDAKHYANIGVIHSIWRKHSLDHGQEWITPERAENTDHADLQEILKYLIPEAPKTF